MLGGKFSVINERTNEIHISWLMPCAGVTFQLALVCARKYASRVQLGIETEIVVLMKHIF
jgi:hypothetical protein